MIGMVNDIRRLSAKQCMCEETLFNMMEFAVYLYDYIGMTMSVVYRIVKVQGRYVNRNSIKTNRPQIIN